MSLNVPFSTEPQVKHWPVLFSLLLGFFLSLLDATVVNIALPTIQSFFRSDESQVSWVLNAYTLAFAVALIPFGRLADLWGRKKVFLAGMVLFTLASLGCALSSSLVTLVVFRAIQGLGAAVLTSVSLAILTVVFPPNIRWAAYAVWGALSGLASAIGPVLGGFLVQNWGWNWIFLINVPLCAIGLVQVAFVVPETRSTEKAASLDLGGAFLLASGLLAGCYGLVEAPREGWTSLTVLVSMTIALISLVVFVLVELRQKSPLLDFKLFRESNFRTANLAVLLFGIALQGAFIVLVFYFVIAKGMDALQAAYAMTPVPLSSFLISAGSSQVRETKARRFLSALGFLLLCGGFLAFAFLPNASDFWQTTWRGVLLGVGMGLVFTTLPETALSRIPHDKLGVASGTFNAFRQIGFLLGVAVLISLFAGQITPVHTKAQNAALAMVQGDQKIPSDVRETMVSFMSSAKNRDATWVDKIPNSAAWKGEATVLSAKIQSMFEEAFTGIFRSLWAVCSGLAALGFVLLLFHRPGAET